MHATLRIPELLRSIFENSSREDNIQNALVCKQWSDISLDVVWYDVHMRDLPAFFNLLAPVKLNLIQPENWPLEETYGYEFERDPDVNDWGRFCTHYCPRIHRLLLECRELQGKVLTAILQYLLRKKPARPLLPKLTELTCHYGPQHKRYFGSLDNLFVFTHEDLKHISISISLYTNIDASAFFKLLPLQSPNLTHLEFRCAKTGSNAYDEALMECLGGLPSLSTVILPSIPDGSSIFTRLKSLKRFGLCSFNNDGKSAPENPMKHPLQFGALCGLEHLHLTVRYHLVTASLLAQSDLPDLKSIVVCSPLMESPDAIKQLSSAIAETCLNVEKVHLVFNLRSISVTKFKRNFPFESLPSLSDIRPLLQCNQINDLKFTHFYALRMYTSLDQPTSFIQSLPNLKSLVLNPYGYTPMTLKAELSATFLLKFAEAVPNIEYIGIRFTVATLPSDQELFAQGTLPYILRSLQTLDVGRSKMKDGDEVRTAFFLSGILPRGCRILSEADSPTLKEWNSVQRLLPQIIDRAKSMSTTVDTFKKAALKTVEDKLNGVEEKLNESLSSNAILEKRLLELTQELKEEREKNASFSLGLEESVDEEEQLSLDVGKRRRSQRLRRVAKLP
ncbi:hypothetical protein K435DRAFT_782099 [Dendrothele bispora CBS 962.96]|uniref:F-box domain-containing protein n=1 Tax=Dendrothele bispora (strain CBS 962.96) TaxID=1314807 RepID=A0A4S8LHB5_DENBC|nr:hypothetical protein K435DRAFT_782099 [Dendrothele bispora CBS 962.96]